MDQEKLMHEIIRDMLRAAFERIGKEILKEHPEFSEADIKAEAARLTTIYLENYDRDANIFDMEMIQRISGISFMGE